MGRAERSVGSTPGSGRLIVVMLPPGEAINSMWARERRLPARWRWTIRALDYEGKIGNVPGLSDRLFPSYSRAVAALLSHLEAEK